MHVEENLIGNNYKKGVDYKLGSIPNLHSLVPMSQVSHKPIFCLAAADGIVGAHFAKVNEAYEIFNNIAHNFVSNLEAMG